MNKVLIISLIVAAQCLFAQWSTSPYTKDAMFACPGFYSEIVSFKDGSSVIIGTSDQNEVWMQKLDEQGYKQWLPWVTVFPPHPGFRLYVPDDDGGIYAVVGKYAQRINKHGALRWGEEGKIIIPSGSLTNMVTDGANGIIGIYNYFDGAQQRIITFRYDSSGTLLWEKHIDSSATAGGVQGNITGRLGKKVLINTSRNEYMLLDIDGTLQIRDGTYLKSHSFAPESDSTAFNIQLMSFQQDSIGNLTKIRVVKLLHWDTLWTFSYESRSDSVSYLNVGNSFFADRFGNLIHVSAFFDKHDSAFSRYRRISRYGYINGKEGYTIKGIAGRRFYFGNGKLVLISDQLFVQSVDTSGNILWPDSVKVIIDTDNSYIQQYQGDNKGGVILSFWTVAGGIKVMHSGRTGVVGRLTKISHSAETLLSDFYLYQNYPNPFNASTIIKFSIHTDATVAIIIYDGLGREVERISDGKLTRGTYQIEWNANRYSSGVYFYQMTVNNRTISKKMIVLK